MFPANAPSQMTGVTTPRAEELRRVAEERAPYAADRDGMDEPRDEPAGEPADDGAGEAG